MAGKLEIIFIAPQDFGSLSGIFDSGEDVVKVDDLIPGSISYNHEHGSLIGLESILE